MSAGFFYDLDAPTAWVEAPRFFSFSSVQSLRACARRWQLVHSGWGPYPKFPERPQPTAIEGQIVHEALDLLARELGRHGRPAIASAGFREALDRSGFWAFFAAEVNNWNRRLASHPRPGPRYVLRTNPRDLANQAVRLLRDRYQPGTDQPVDAGVVDQVGAIADADALPLSLLHARGALSELRLGHPTLPLVGVLDAVALEKDRSATIVDFKTGVRKPAHEEQLLLYALLWWRTTGTLPGKVVVQYLESSWVLCPSEAELAATEKSIAKEIDRARDALSSRPAAAKPGDDCTWCPVRPRCNEGWARTEKASQTAGHSNSVDIEVAISSKPTPTGFLGTRSNGDEVALVFDAAVGCGLPVAKTGDRFRIIDASSRAEGKEIVLLPWTEMYRL